MASPRKKMVKPTDIKLEESPSRLPPLRQSPRKKPPMKQTDGLMLLIEAGSVIDQKAKNADSFQPDPPRLEVEAHTAVAPVIPRPASGGASSGEEAPTKKPPAKAQKWTKRNLQTVEAITFDMLMKLPTKTLVDLFSERLQTDNQYEDRILFKCKFFEDAAICSEEFKGYRNEDQVRRRMEEHMVKHRNDLIKKGAASTDFKTTSVQYRIKQEKQAEIKRKKVTSSSSVGVKRGSKFTAIKANSPVGINEDDVSSQSDSSGKAQQKGSAKVKKTKRETPRKQVSKQANKENKPTTTASVGTENTPQASSQSQRRKKAKSASVSGASSCEDQTLDRMSTAEGEDPKPYPVCDHDYATPAGHERRVFEQCGSDAEMLDSDDEASVSSGVSLASSASQDLSRGIHLYDAGLANTPMVCKEETFDDSMPERKFFPSTSKASGRGHAYDPEDTGYGDEDMDSKVGIKKQRRPALPRTKNDEIPEWEKKAALKYIRELKQRKKDEKIEYICKICKEGKKFTAGATLIYHYRSHAGIKPFECHDCGQKFTRQHSKNYHMMIHRNESRFVCKDCGKRFRHPSHYNEHKRKHTGETPYECEDCKMKFKTRNTYKRHLKTRHGKLLTARGIKRMSREEFAKVRTKPYKKSNESSPSHEHGAPLTLEPQPGPSGYNMQTPTDPKQRRVKPAPSALSPKVPIAPATVTMVQRSSVATVSLPPVSTLLPSFVHTSGSGTSVRVAPPVTMVSHSQASVGVIPPMGALRQASSAMGPVLGVTMMGHSPGPQMTMVRQAGMVAPAPQMTMVRQSGMVAPGPQMTMVRQAGMVTPGPQMTMVRQAGMVAPGPQMTMVRQGSVVGQPSISLPSLQGQTYYTITAYTPIVPMETQATAYPAQPAQPQVSQVSPLSQPGDEEQDGCHYKPVGYVTHQ